MLEEPPYPLPLNARKAITAVILAGRAIQPLTKIARRLGVPQVWSTCESRLPEIALSGLASHNSETLDEFVVRALDSLKGSVDLHLSDQPELRTAVVQRLKNAASSISCKACSIDRSLPLCQGKIADDITVHADGFCLADLRRQFAVVLTVVRDYYRFYCQENSGDFMEVTFHLDTVPSRSKFKSNGSTTRRNDGSTLVTLSLDIQAFSWRTYLETAYVLFHECVAHCFCVFTDVDPADEFTEGWMDFVAHRVMLDYLTRSPGPTKAELLDFRLERAQAGSDLYLARKGWNDPISGARSQGNETAERFLLFLSDLRGEGYAFTPAEYMYHLSFRLNRLPLTLDQRQEMVHSILLALPSAGIPESRVNRPMCYLALLDAITAFAQTLDAHEFVRTLPSPPPLAITLANFSRL
jgi:hypothetical protein